MNVKGNLILSIYRAVLPLSIRTGVGQLRNCIRRWGWRVRACMERQRLQRIQAKVSTLRAHRQRRRKWKRILASGKRINVLFEVTCVSKWKADFLLTLMLQHPRFNPIVWHVCHYGSPEADLNNRDDMEFRQCVEYFKKRGAKLVRYVTLGDFPPDEMPDIIFPNEPYNGLVVRPHHTIFFDFLWCFVPYGYISMPSNEGKNQVIPNGALFFFAENDQTVRTCCSLLDNKGVNAVVTGNPMADAFLVSGEKRPPAWKSCSSGLKKVIWAPHWTIEPDTSTWLHYGTFLQTGEILLEMAEKYQDRIQVAFKPHPNLYDALCKHPEWGRERAEAFYSKWREMGNTQLEDGAYADLFMQSDAMIHDCGSFIQEYLFADKPCMYLRDAASRQEYSVMATDCLNAYQIGITVEDIEAFLQMVLREEDPKAEVRREMRERYLLPPNGKSAAQNIIDCLLDVEVCS